MRASSERGTASPFAREDYKKEAEQRAPDYNALQNKAKLVSYDFGLKKRISQLDRDADRRWMFASMKARIDEANGKEPVDSAPFEDAYKMPKPIMEKVHKFLTEANKLSSEPEIEKLLKENPPSDDFKIQLPRVLHEKIASKAAEAAKDYEDFAANHSEAEAKEYTGAHDNFMKAVEEIMGPYYEARKANEKKVEDLKAFFRSQKAPPGKTKADVVKEIWKVPTFQMSPGTRIRPNSPQESRICPPNMFVMVLIGLGRLPLPRPRF